jgi:hypothetical protein
VDVGTVVAICSILIASLALIVSILEARAARKYNECSVRPLLELSHRMDASWAGIHLVNYGLGPAVVDHTVLVVDGSIKGTWDLVDIEKILPDHRTLWPTVTSLRDGRIIGVGYDSPIYGLKNYDPYGDERGFWGLIRNRMYLEVHYRSLYGEQFVATIGSRQAPAAIDQGNSEISGINEKPTIGDICDESSTPQVKATRPDSRPV